MEGNREFIGLFRWARATILPHATSDWPDLVPGLVDDMEELVRRLPKGVTLAQKCPEIFDVTVPPPSSSPSAGSGAADSKSVPPVPDARRMTLRASPLRRNSAYCRNKKSRYPPVASRRRNKRPVRSLLLVFHRVCLLSRPCQCKDCQQRKRRCIPLKGADPQGCCTPCMKDRQKCIRVAEVTGT